MVVIVGLTVIIVGETEMNEQKFALKNLSSGEQILLDFAGLKENLKIFEINNSLKIE